MSSQFTPLKVGEKFFEYQKVSLQRYITDLVSKYEMKTELGYVLL